MNHDATALKFAKEFYEAFSNNEESIDAFYVQECPLNIFSVGEPQQQFTTNYHEHIPKGERTILRANGIVIGDKATIHFSGYQKNDDNFTQTNEMMILKAAPGSDQAQILFHSINFSAMSEKPIIHEEAKEPEPEIKPEPEETQEKEIKEEPKYRVVTDPKEIFHTRACICSNLPFKVPPESILPEFELYGKITTYSPGKGKIIIEFETIPMLLRCLRDGDFDWKGRTIRIAPFQPNFK